MIKVGDWKCPNCGNSYADSVKECPNDATNRNSFMINEITKSLEDKAITEINVEYGGFYPYEKRKGAMTIYFREV